MDLSSYHGYFLESVTVATAPASTAAIAMARGTGEHVVLTLAHVVRVAMDGPGDWSDFIDEISVRRLPRTGPWPPEAHHLLQHHNNDTDLLWVTLTGPTQIEIVARALTTEHQGTELRPARTLISPTLRGPALSTHGAGGADEITTSGSPHESAATPGHNH